MVKRSRHRPFTAVTRVRFPVESPNYFARLAELADALDLGSSGRPWGFKSLIAHHKHKKRHLYGVFFFMLLVNKKGLKLNGRERREKVLWTFEQ